MVGQYKNGGKELRPKGEPEQTIVNLIAATTTRKGMKVKTEPDSGLYPKGIKVTAEEFATIHIFREEFHGEWNYSILPH